jgi:hypothetical protein
MKGRLLHTSYGQSKLLLVMVDEGNPGQAGVTRFPLNFLSGIMRPQFNPVDGQLYVVGLRGWQTTAVKDGCLQRVRYTGKPAAMPLTLRVRKTGIDLGFSDALDAEIASDADSWTALGFNVVSTPDYGSPEFQVGDPKKRGREKLEISKAVLGADGKTVSLEIPALRPMTNLLVKFSLRTAAGARLQSEVVLTVNQLPD